jgi:hypothetical protein
MVKAVLFDLFETLITEFRTRPRGVSSPAPRLGVNARLSANTGKCFGPL